MVLLLCDTVNMGTIKATLSGMSVKKIYDYVLSREVASESWGASHFGLLLQ